MGKTVGHTQRCILEVFAGNIDRNESRCLSCLEEKASFVARPRARLDNTEAGSDPGEYGVGMLP